MKSHTRLNRSILSAAAVLAFGILASQAHANDPAPAPTPPPAPAPATPPASDPAPTARKEEETPASPGRKLGVFDAAAAAFASKRSLLEEIGSLKAEVASLKAAALQTQTTLDAQTAELAELRAGKAKLDAALSAATAEKRTVEETVAAAGFAATKLPAQVPEESAASAEEVLLAKFKAETDPRKAAELYAQIKAAREAKK